MHRSTLSLSLSVFLPSRLVAGLAIATVLGACLSQAVPASIAGNLSGEAGPPELASAFLLGVAAIVGVVVAARRVGRARIAAAICLVGLFLRELDFQKRFTYRSIESVGFYTRPIASWAEKTIALAVLCLIGVAAWVIMRAAYRRLSQAIEGREAWLGSVSAAGVLVSLGLLSEKFLGFTVAEEFFETGFAGVVLALVVQTRGLEAVTLCSSEDASGDVVRFATAESPSEQGAEGAEVDDRRSA